jgi:hypothetical protein
MIYNLAPAKDHTSYLNPSTALFKTGPASISVNISRIFLGGILQQQYDISGGIIRLGSIYWNLTTAIQ